MSGLINEVSHRAIDRRGSQVSRVPRERERERERGGGRECVCLKRERERVSRQSLKRESARFVAKELRNKTVAIDSGRLVAHVKSSQVKSRSDEAWEIDRCCLVQC